MKTIVMAAATAALLASSAFAAEGTPSRSEDFQAFAPLQRVDTFNAVARESCGYNYNPSSRRCGTASGGPVGGVGQGG